MPPAPAELRARNLVSGFLVSEINLFPTYDFPVATPFAGAAQGRVSVHEIYPIYLFIYHPAACRCRAAYLQPIFPDPNRRTYLFIYHQICCCGARCSLMLTPANTFIHLFIYSPTALHTAAY